MVNWTDVLAFYYALAKTLIKEQLQYQGEHKHQRALGKKVVALTASLWITQKAQATCRSTGWRMGHQTSRTITRPTDPERPTSIHLSPHSNSNFKFWCSLKSTVCFYQPYVTASTINHFLTGTCTYTSADWHGYTSTLL